MATVLQDTFTGADGTRIDDHAPEIGGLWVPWEPVGIANAFRLTLSSSQVVSPATAAFSYYNSTPEPSADYSVSMDFTFAIGSFPRQEGNIYARRSDSQNYYKAMYLQNAFINGGAGTLRIVKAVAGIETVLAELSPDDIGGTGPHTYKFELIGATLNVYRDGVLKLTATDASLSAAGYAGFGLNSSIAGNAADNFLAQSTQTSSPGVAIKTRMQSIINTAMGPGGTGQFKNVLAQYPRLSEKIGIGDLPQVIISIDGHTEKALAAGKGQSLTCKQLDWKMLLHVVTELDNPLTDAGAWDQLIDDMEELFRSHPRLDALNGTMADGRTFQVLHSGTIDRRPNLLDRVEMRNAYNGYATITVREIVG